MSTKEIITLQFGHYANFVGAHWWNVQENSFVYNPEKESPSEINHDVLYREGLTQKGQTTFTPRLLLADLKGSLKALPERGDLYENTSVLRVDENLELPWDHDAIHVQKEAKIDKNKFQHSLDASDSNKTQNDLDLDKEVQVWSDFLYARLHPRSVNVVKEYQHRNDSPAFDVYPLGCNMWNEQFGEDFCDKIRQYVEECDHLQGFHILLDGIDAFSGLSCSCMEYLNDEFERKSIFAVPLIPSYYDDYDYSTDEGRHKSIIKDSIRVLNLALCFNSLNEFSSLFTPLSVGSTGWRQPGLKREFYHTNYDHKLPYHSSAILASALDTFTLKHRLKSSDYNLIDLCTDLNGHGRKAAAGSICLPFSFNSDITLIDCLDKWEGPLLKSLTPNCAIGTDKLMQMVTLRGIPKSRLKLPPERANKQKEMPAYQYNTVEDMLNFYLSCTSYATVSNVTAVEKGLVTKVPFPNIFDANVGINGNIVADPRHDTLHVNEVPVLSGLHSGSSVGDMIESLHTESRKIKFQRFHQFINAGLEQDDFTECLDKLFEFRECYVDNYNM